MALLFDTDAISELLRPQPNPSYLEWVRIVPRENQFTSAICIAELFKGAFRSEAQERHLRNIEKRVLPAVTVLPFDVATAKVFGQIRAELEKRGRPLPDADIQIAATAVYHGLHLVTGNIKHFRRIPQVSLNHTLAEARRFRLS
ncbi:MAG: type II toxin-antitoxin system VapC family toxin [Gemmatimonadota bacterium]